MEIPMDTKNVIERALATLSRKAARSNEHATRIAAHRGDEDAIRQVKSWDREDGKKAFPLYLPDGDDVKSLAQVAALMSVTPTVAAHYVAEEKGLLPALYLEAKKLMPAPADDETGIAIMMQPDEETAIWLTGMSPMALRNGPEDLHITLGYFGEVGPDAPSKEELTRIVRALAAGHGEFPVKLNGLIRFNGGKTDPLVANADSPVIEDLRMELRRMLDVAGIELERSHGYTPHMTLGYLPKDEETPFSTFPSHPDREMPPVIIRRIGLWYGKHQVNVQFTGGNK